VFCTFCQTHKITHGKWRFIEGVVTSDKRIKASLPTIEMAMKQGAKVMLMSHRGRPMTIKGL
jgi:3-phosphoglycerate kinase